MAEPTKTELAEEISLDESLEAAREAIDKFLNNKFEEAYEIIEPKAENSIYHAMGYAVFKFLKAAMMFEEKQIQEASTVLEQALITIDKFRKKNGVMSSLGRLFWQTNYENYTDLEVHAELCFAEVLLLKSVLNLIEDQSLMSFVKAGMKVHVCFQSYRECMTIMQNRKWENDQHRKDFESGVRLGVGCFNLMVSILPAKIMNLLKLIGFRFDKEAGVAELKKVYEEKQGLRQFLASMVLLIYHLYLHFFIGSSGSSDMELCKDILKQKLALYPEGAFFLCFQGRFHFSQGQMDKAIEFYTASYKSQNEWPQFHHLCYWDLALSHQLSLNYWEAYKFSKLLYQESQWSKCFYAYMQAANMCMVQDELSQDQKKEQEDLMHKVPSLKLKVAGKSLPMEKFAISKANRFLEQGNYLVLPVLEIIYVWNLFDIFGKSEIMTKQVDEMIDQCLKNNTELGKDTTHQFYNENLALCKLLKGKCFKFMGLPKLAEDCFETVISLKSELTRDPYLIPYAMYEKALLLKEQTKFEEAMDILERIKNEDKDYILQSLLHIRIHSAQTDIKCQNKDIKESPSKNEDISKIVPPIQIMLVNE